MESCPDPARCCKHFNFGLNKYTLMTLLRIPYSAESAVQSYCRFGPSTVFLIESSEYSALGVPGVSKKKKKLNLLSSCAKLNKLRKMVKNTYFLTVF